MTRLGTWIAPYAFAISVGASGAVAAADVSPSESANDPVPAVANVDAPLPALVRWRRLQTTAHRRERTAVMADCRDLLNEWRNDPRRADVLFFLGQLCERSRSAGQHSSDPVQALSWFELAATVTAHDNPNWLKYELTAVDRSLWKSKPGDPVLNDLHRRLDIAERNTGDSPMDMARVLQTRFALTRRQHDLAQAEIVCHRLRDLQSASEAASLSDSARRRLSEICAESATTLVRAWGQSPEDAQTREQQIQDLGREFAINPPTVDAAIRLSSRRVDSASAAGPRLANRRTYIWLWLFNGGFILLFVMYRINKHFHPRPATSA